MPRQPEGLEIMDDPMGIERARLSTAKAHELLGRLDGVEKRWVRERAMAVLTRVIGRQRQERLRMVYKTHYVSDEQIHRNEKATRRAMQILARISSHEHA
jgi:hypothetical protein